MIAADTEDSPLKIGLRWTAAAIGTYIVAHSVFQALTRFRLKGKVALITGGSRGLGLVLARQLGYRGVSVAICARSADDLAKAQQDLEERGIPAFPIIADVTIPEEVDAAVRDTINHFGRVDVLINNAGIIQVGPQDLMDLSDYQLAMQTNFWAHLYAMHAVIPHFTERGGGRIVNITSIGGKLALPHLLPYTASKFAAVGLSEGMHAELRKYNIIVTTVVPNLMRTGSPLNADIKGDYQREYAWFKHADSNPLLSQSAEHVAERIIRAIEYGESEVTLSLSAKLATFVKGFAPGWVNTIMRIADRLLPTAITSDKTAVKGWQAESSLSQGPISRLTDNAARKNNQ
jgi:NAD(P)-dependent dehydrogenase (short-subunit alcohol dehydrogenase family)